ncbi:MAG TPA: hypothetical protein VND64_33715 [Pirellulales bacterium]|nr:hypothetical protein [Pirellulales bacterium]
MSSAWLRTPRLNEPEDFRENEEQAERHDASRALTDRFGEFTPPRPTVRETCRCCAGAGAFGQFSCSMCRGKGYRSVFVDRHNVPSCSAPSQPRAMMRLSTTTASSPAGRVSNGALETVWHDENLLHDERTT